MEIKKLLIDTNMINGDFEIEPSEYRLQSKLISGRWVEIKVKPQMEGFMILTFEDGKRYTYIISDWTVNQIVKYLNESKYTRHEIQSYGYEITEGLVIE